MLPGARMLFAGRRLPYDAEVEYLESTGTQMIDTGVYHETANTVRFKVRLPSSGQWSNAFTAYVAENAPTTRIIVRNYYQDNMALIYCGCYAGQGPGGTRVQGDASRMFEGWMHGPSMSAVVNGVNYTLSTKPLVARLGVTMKVLNDRAGGGRVYYFAIDNQIDLTPVRFTNEQSVSEGAMYDKVTGQLFRNQGNGGFIIGPDRA